MFREPQAFEAQNKLKTLKGESLAPLEKVLVAYYDQKLALRFVGDYGMEHLSENPSLVEAQIKSLFDKGYALRQDAEGFYHLSRGLRGGMLTLIDTLERKLDSKSVSQRSIFITYQWAQKDIAIALHAAFAAKGFMVIRDDALEHNANIQDFMKIINHQNLDYVLPIISKSYLQSKNCMYEVNQIMKRPHWERSLIPYVVRKNKQADANIYTGVGPYIDHWEQKRAEEKDVAQKKCIDNILENIRPFSATVATRINVPEEQLIDTHYQPLFEMIAKIEQAREGTRFQEIEEFLRVAENAELKENHEKAKKSFESAIAKLDEMEHLGGIKDISAKVYGLYGEYLLREDNQKDGEKYLRIGKKFGFKPSGTSEDSSAALSNLRLEPANPAKVVTPQAAVSSPVPAAPTSVVSSSSPSAAATHSPQSTVLIFTPPKTTLMTYDEYDTYVANKERFSESIERAKNNQESIRYLLKIRKSNPELYLKLKRDFDIRNGLIMNMGGTELAHHHDAAAPSVNAQELSQFLSLVAQGEQGQAETMLQKNRDLVLCAGNVEDLSGRTFEGITGFQYAVWALDFHMWTMLRRYLPDDQAAAQLMSTGSWVRTHGLHAGMPGGPLEKLSTALKAYIDNYQAWTVEQCSQHWQKQVGGAQVWLPVHAIHEYCRPDRSFSPCPAFLEPTLPRTRRVGEGEWFTATYRGGSLGEKFGIYRGVESDACVSFGRVGRGWRGGVLDQEAVYSLTKVRAQQRDQLLSELSREPQHTAQRRPGQ